MIYLVLPRINMAFYLLHFKKRPICHSLLSFAQSRFSYFFLHSLSDEYNKFGLLRILVKNKINYDFLSFQTTWTHFILHLPGKFFSCFGDHFSGYHRAALGGLPCTPPPRQFHPCCSLFNSISTAWNDGIYVLWKHRPETRPLFTVACIGTYGDIC